MNISILQGENRRIRRVVADVRQDIAAAEGLPDNVLSLDLARRLLGDVGQFTVVFGHYKRKEQLLLPHLERHGIKNRTNDELDADNAVRGSVAMALSLLPGAQERPSATNLQSVAWQLEAACDAAERVITREEDALLPLAAQTLDATDWDRMAADVDELVGPMDAGNPATWGPSALDMAEARLRALR